jgi:ribosomal-protein-alanine N-acetyltransferase
MTLTRPRPSLLHIRSGSAADLDDVMRIMDRAFDPEFGEAWTRSQCLGILPMTGVALLLAEEEGGTVGFALHRLVADEAELLLLAVDPAFHRRGVGSRLLHQFMADSALAGASRLHLEVRENNPAAVMYRATGFEIVGRRRNYYTGRSGGSRDALTLSRTVG